MKKKLLIKNLLLPQLSASEIFLESTILILSIPYVSTHSSVLIPGHTREMQIWLSDREGTDNKVGIKSVWCIQEKLRLQKVGVAAGFL